jgi:hypothetical protein
MNTNQSAAIAVVMLTLVEITAAAASSSARGTAHEECTDSVRTAITPVTLHLVDHGGLTRQAREEMMREAVHPWRAVGANVEWASSAPTPQRVQVRVIVTRDTVNDEAAFASSRERRMASILFVDGKPIPLVNVYLVEVLRLLEGVRVSDKALSDRPAALRDRLMGRALGRAVAHELGHFLFGSADHAPFGLMRATHPIEHLIGKSSDALDLVMPPSLACVARLNRYP